MFDVYGDKTQHPTITAWAVAKYGLEPDANVTVERVKEFHGYCPTCAYEEEFWIVYDNSGGNKLELARFEDDLASLLKEILDFGATLIKKES